MTTARPSMQELIRRRRRAGFIGRRDELAAYRANFDCPPQDERHRFIFHIRGNAGVGKTSLVRELEQTARERGALTAYVDETVNSVPEAMAAISARLAQQGHACKALDRLLATYRQRRYEAESASAALFEPQPGTAAAPGENPAPASAPAPTAGSMVVAQAGLVGLGLLPGVGAFAGAVDPAQLAHGADRLRAALSARFGKQEDVQLVLDPLQMLTPVLIAELDRAAAGAPWLTLFFDTYERTGPFLDTWLRDLITTERYGALPANVVVTLAGQQRLDPGCWADYADLVEDLPLEPFTESEARQLLSAKGVVAEPVVQDVLRLSGRLPVLVSTLAENPGDVNAPSATAVDRFLKWERDPVRRAAALACALPRRLNEDIFRAAVEEDAAGLAGWLWSLPFVSDRGGRAQYHDVVRTPMLRLQRASSPERWGAQHGRLAAAFARWRQAAEEGAQRDEHWTRETWREPRLEESYHLLCARPRAALPLVLRDGVDACAEGPAVARRWARTLSEAGRDGGADTRTGTGAGTDDGARSDGGTRTGTDTGAGTRTGVGGGTGTRAGAGVGRGVGWSTDSGSGSAASASALGSGSGSGSDADVVRQWGEDCLRALEDQEGGPTRVLGLLLDRAVLDVDGQVSALLVRAARHRVAKRYNDAFADCERALGAAPENWRAYYGRGITHRDLGADDRALADFDRAEELAAGVDAAAAVRERGETFRRLGRLEEAITELDRALALDPADSRAYGSRGVAERARGRLAEALADLNRAVELDATYWWALLRRAQVRRSLGDTPGALADLDRADALAPDTPGITGERGETYRLDDRYDKAVAEFDRTIALDSEYGWAYGSRGAARHEQGRFDEALADLDRAVELDAAYWWALVWRARARSRLGDGDGCFADLDRAVELAPRNAWVLVSRGDELRQAGRPEEAIADFDRALAVKPDDAWAIGCRGRARRVLGQYDEALTDLDRADALLPDTGWILADRGVARLATDRFDEAYADLDRAVALQPQDGWSLVQRAKLHVTTGRLESALADLARCHELGYAAAGVQRLRAVVSLFQGRPEEVTGAVDRGDVPASAVTGQLAAALRKTGRLGPAAEAAQRGFAESPRYGAFQLAMLAARTDGVEHAADAWRQAEVRLREASVPAREADGDLAVIACALGEWERADAVLAAFLGAGPPWAEVADAQDAVAELLLCPGADRARLEPYLQRLDEAKRDRTPPGPYTSRTPVDQ